jgi:hypothetical protein
MPTIPGSPVPLPGPSATPGVPAPRRGARTPATWLAALEPLLNDQATKCARYEAYYDGHHPLAFATAKFREAFGTLLEEFADNWCEIVVDAPVERLAVVGFRFGEEDDGDDDAWQIWQRNNLDAESVIAHTEAGKCGKAYLLVDPNRGDPRITVEHPSQVVVACDPANRRRRLAALKRWVEDDGYWYATVYLPSFVMNWRSSEPVKNARPQWVPLDDISGSHTLGAVPVVPLENAPTLLKGGRSDLRPAIPIQNAINKLCDDMIVASEFGAFRQRVLTGVEIPRDPVTGQPLKSVEITSAIARMLTFESTDAKVFDLAPTDLANFRTAIEMFVEHLAAQTHTPSHYISGKIVNASGDALKAAEAGLTAKCKRKILNFSDGWEEAMALALRGTGRQVSAEDGEVLWRDPETRSVGEVTDSLVKKRTLGVPLETLWAEMGYTPAQIKRMKRQAGLPDRPPPGATTAQTPPLTDVLPAPTGGGTPPAQ